MYDGTSCSDTSCSRQDRVTEQIDRLFCDHKTAEYGPYNDRDHGVELIPGHVYRYTMRDQAEQAVSLQVFCGLESLGGQLWEQEVRALLRVSGLRHRALPQILDGGYDADNSLGFVVVESADYNLAATRALPYMRSRLADCVRQLALLVDALAVLHGQGLVHRGILPRSVDVLVDNAHTGRIRLRLARFEMSSLISSMVRRARAPCKDETAEFRSWLMPKDARELAFCPPERLGYLSSDPSADMLETDRSDVYSLGVLAWEWFVGDLPEDVLAEGLAGGCQEVAWQEQVRKRLDTGIAQAHDLPARLQDLLRSMLQPNPRWRLSSGEVVSQISRHYDALLAPFESPVGDKPLLVAFMPAESVPTLYKWGWLDHDPTTPPGRIELKHFLQTELRGAILVFSPNGAAPYVPFGDKASQKEARLALIGRRGVWFCDQYRAMDPFGEIGDTLPEILLIRYTVERGKAHDLEALPFQRRVSRVDAVPWDVLSKDYQKIIAGRPEWTPLIEAVQVEGVKPEWHKNFEFALGWLLELQDVEIRARTYPFIRDSDSGASYTVRVRYDRQTDDSRIHTSALFSLYASKPTRRPSFGDYFADVFEGADGESSSLLECCPSERGRPRWDRRIRARLVTRLDDDHIELAPISRKEHVPEHGWLRSAREGLNEHSLHVQRDAYAEFIRSKFLVEQFREPFTIPGLLHRWRGAGSDLKGDATDIVRDMLVCQPFYALQGPPGTGKTTVASRAVKAFLQAEPTARLLVSAQSNFALDNLAETILKHIAKSDLDIQAIRVSSQSSEDKIHPSIADYRLEECVIRLSQKVRESCKLRLDRRIDPPAIRKILGQWMSAVEESKLELQDRIRRGANLVFATCATATERNVGAGRTLGIYDWVIIEEAAKAWPTELAIPLIRGVRWTLIGDQEQLEAHRKGEIEAILVECAHSNSDELRQHAERSKAYKRTFELFRSLFEDENGESRVDPSSPVASSGCGARRPLGRLTTQFRMREDIAITVSRAFYPDPNNPGDDGLLKTYREKTEFDSKLTAPIQLGNRTLVWLDTEEVDCCRDEKWKNPGEVEVVVALLRAMKPAPHSIAADPGTDPLAILTPYRDQIKALERSRIPSEYRKCIFSVHEFQGRQANIVIASLVRDRKWGATIPKNFGHVGRPALANVLISRARRLLVLVGRYRHFSESGIDFWTSICETVKTKGHILKAEQVLPKIVEGE